MPFLTACAGDEPEVVGRWQPVSVPAADLSSGFDRSEATIEFRADGTWQGSDGCNAESGSFSLDGHQFDAEAAEGIDVGRGCPGGQVDYGRLFTAVTRVDLTAGELEFSNEDDDLVMRLEPAG